MITQLHLKNFKAFRDAATSLERLTVFLGPNASGKSSLLEALHYMAQLGATAPGEIFRGPWALTQIATRLAESLEFELHASREAEKGWTRWIFQKPGQPAPKLSPLWRGPENFGGWDLWQGGEWPGPTPMESKDRMGKAICSALRLRLEPGRLREASFAEDDEAPRMKYDGEGLATALAYLKLGNSKSFDEIVERLARVVPSVRSVRIEPAKVQLEAGGHRMGYGVVFDTKAGDGIPAVHASEGTLLVLGILTALWAASHPRLLLIDDLDRALHPLAQRELVVLLRELLSVDPELQIVATSHSPYLVDCLKPEEIRITTVAAGDGSAVLAKLTDHPEFDRWKDQMAPGEFWSMVGEGWVERAAVSGNG